MPTYEKTILGRTFTLFLSKEEGRGYEKGIHRKLSLYREPRGDLVARGEVHLPGTSCGIRLAVTYDNEPVHASIRIPPIALYGSLDTEPLRRFRDWICRVFPGDMGGRYSGRAFEISIHDYAVWWDLGSDDTGWTNSRPRWRDGSWYPLGHRMRQGEPVQLEEREVLIPMPERSYRAVAKLHRSGWASKSFRDGSTRSSTA